MSGFFEFIRKRGVVGLAIGFMLGGAISKTVTALVDDVINPLVGLALGSVGLSEATWTIGEAELKWGHFVSAIVDFVIVALIVYIGVKLLDLDEPEKQAERAEK